MVDIIKLLPENVANQIAAGEVIQRPASAVKELMENAVDAGATRIDLVIKDAGRTLIQVSDNGCGISATDMERCIQRHATSKIRSTEDLFAIRTLGFRGEALASIASVAQLEIRSRQHGEDIGNLIEAEGSRITGKSEVATPVGSIFMVKNLFFNVPARRKFLKSNTAEMRHILEEFCRVALVRTGISFSLHHNGKTIHKVNEGNTLQRIAALFGRSYREKLLEVELNTDQFSVYGYVGKPEHARKTRGEQYFFANGRYFRHPYLHHAVLNAFQELIPESSHPIYFLFMEVDPASVDVNIHPTKTEIKFQDEKMIYGMLRSAVREAIGKSSAMPSIDFDREKSFELPPGMEDRPVRPPEIKVDPDFNPFKQGHSKLSASERQKRERWAEMFSTSERMNFRENTEGEGDPGRDVPSGEEGIKYENIFQIKGTYIVSSLKNGLLVMHQQRAHEKILFERFMASFRIRKSITQKQLFPVTVHFSPADASILKELTDELSTIGFEVREMGGNSFVIDGIPSDIGDQDTQAVLEAFLESYKEGREQNKEQDVITAKAMARSLAVKSGQKLRIEEMHALVDGLFACPAPESSPDGKPTLMILRTDDLDQRFYQDINKERRIK